MDIRNKQLKNNILTHEKTHMSLGYANIILNNQTTSYVSCPNVGPYDSSQYPCIVSNLNNGVLSGHHPNPSQFSNMNGGNNFSSGRAVYSRVFSKLNTALARQVPKSTNVCDGLNNIIKPKRFLGPLSSLNYPIINNKNYIAPMSSSQSIGLKRAGVIGKSSLKTGLPNEAPLSYKSYDKNFTRNAIRRTRSSGCVTPAKCNSIYNRTFTSINAFTQSSYN